MCCVAVALSKCGEERDRERGSMCVCVCVCVLVFWGSRSSNLIYFTAPENNFFDLENHRALHTFFSPTVSTKVDEAIKQTASQVCHGREREREREKREREKERERERERREGDRRTGRESEADLDR